MKCAIKAILSCAIALNLSTSLISQAQEGLTLVDINKLGVPLNLKSLDAAELKTVRKLNISEDMSSYVEESSFADPLPRIVKITGGNGKYIFTQMKNVTANGSEEWSEVYMHSLLTGKAISVDVPLRTPMDDTGISYYGRYTWDSGKSGDFNNYLVNDRGDLVSIVRYSATEKTFKNKTTCSRKAMMLKIDPIKNILSITKKVNLPTTKGCTPNITSDDWSLKPEKSEATISSFYTAAFNEALIKLNEK